MTVLYRVRRAGIFGTKCVLQRLDESSGAVWRDVTYSEQIGLFTAVRIRDWHAIEADLALRQQRSATRKRQRAVKQQRDFEASKYLDRHGN